jgi:serine/threonine protein kinase HipA of HipAB toxin-antitoxin module
MNCCCAWNQPLGLYADEDDFRISIAGVQEKTAFLHIDNQWQVPLGPTPTSHIFKPAMKVGPDGADFSDTPWNEWRCLALCRAPDLAARMEGAFAEATAQAADAGIPESTLGPILAGVIKRAMQIQRV